MYKEPQKDTYSRLNLYTVFCGAVAALGVFQLGYRIYELNSSIDDITNCYSDRETLLPNCLPMSAAVIGLTNSIFAAGAFFGSFVGGYMSNKFGRRSAMIYNTLFYFIGGLIGTFSVTPSMLVFGRFISGFGSGVSNVVVPIYLTEISPIESRGTLGMLTVINMDLGIFVAQVMGYFFGTDSRWRIIIAFGTTLAVIQLTLLFFAVESPKYLHSISKVDKAESELRKLRNGDEFEELEIWAQEHNTEKATLLPDNLSTVSSVSTERQNVNLLNIFSIRKYRLPVILVVLLQIGQQLSGVDAVFFYSTTIFADLNTRDIETLLTLFIGISNVVSTLATVSFIDKVRRRNLLFLSIGGIAFSHITLALSSRFGFNAIAVLSVLGVVVFFNIGYGPLPFIIATELFDSSAVDAGNSIALAMSWVGIFAVSISFLPLLNLMGDYVFLIFTFFTLSIGAYLYVYLPETKDKTLHEVVSQLKF